MKKILSLLTTASLMLSLCSCGSDIPEEPSIATNTGTSMFNQIMETEDGYYYNATLFGDLSLRYYDKATGSSLFLCAKPECTHDGNSFCTATGTGFITSYTAMYGDDIYIAVHETKEGRKSYKLLRASLDGTELTEVCTFMNINSSGESPTILFNHESSMVLHRGKAFVPYFISTSDKEMAGRAGAAVIDLESGKYELITEFDMAKTMGVSNVTADGDYFYYTTYFSEDRETLLHRYNFVTNEEEAIPVAESLAEGFGIEHTTEIESYTPVDGKIWYVYHEWTTLTNDIYIFDPETGTTEKAEQFVQKLSETEEIYDTNGELQEIIFHSYAAPELKYDGEYLYVAERSFYGNVYANHDMKVHIFTLEGENLGGFTYERKGACQVNIVNKTVYIQLSDRVLYCTLEDIMNNNTEWKELYKFEENRIDEIEW